MSFNRIEFVDGRIFGDRGDFKMKPLKYLNLESNRIRHFDETLVNLANLVTFIFTGNLLTDFPNFDALLTGDISVYGNFFYFNFNNINSLSYLPAVISGLKTLNL